MRKATGKRYRFCGCCGLLVRKGFRKSTRKGMGKRQRFCGGGGFSWGKYSGVFHKVRDWEAV